MLDQAHDAILPLTPRRKIVYANDAADRPLRVVARRDAGKDGGGRLPGGGPAGAEPGRGRKLGRSGSAGRAAGPPQARARGLHRDARRSLIRDEKGAPKAQSSASATTSPTRRSATPSLLRNQRLESLGTLAGGIAHDLNNVLAPILMSIALLKLKVSDESGQRLLAMLELNAERGAQLVRQVLAFGRGAEGERILIQPLHIAREIEQIVNDTFPKSIRFELVHEREPWTVTGDPTQLHQVLLNLCVNARDALPNGGKITVRIASEALDETFSSMNQGAKPGLYLVISVADTVSASRLASGTGSSSPSSRPRRSAGHRPRPVDPRLGIIQSHGGFMNVSSDMGKGSTFRIYLPANALAAAAAAPRGREVLWPAAGLQRAHPRWTTSSVSPTSRRRPSSASATGSSWRRTAPPRSPSTRSSATRSPSS